MINYIKFVTKYCNIIYKTIMSTLEHLTGILTLVIVWRLWNTTTVRGRFIDTITL